jgi:hypothetical protein
VITYDLLIPTIPHRHHKLCALLNEIDRQWQSGLGVIVYRDNLQASLRCKFQALLDASRADYVSWMDDDDWPRHDYVARVMRAIASLPDYVGFQVCFTVNGQRELPVTHSLRYGGWANTPKDITRDITALNPIRRSCAMQGKWDFVQDHGADRDWARQVRESGCCTTEVFIGLEMYHYRFSTSDSFLTPREPMAGPLPLLPSYHWLRQIEGQPHA